VVFEENLSNFKEISKLNVGAALIVTGNLIETPEAKQKFELHAKSIEIEGRSSSEYPLQKKRHSLEFLRTIAHLRPRTNTFSAIFRVRSAAAFAIHKFFQESGFVYINTPIITGSDCEGAGEMFTVTSLNLNNNNINFDNDFFGKRTSLTVSGQLEAECMAMAFSKVYTFGPTFRAENSNTQRHAAEFWMVEPEVAFADLQDVILLASDMMKFIINYILQNYSQDLEFFDKFYEKDLIKKLENLINNNFEIISYTEAVNILIKSGHKFEYAVKWGNDLQTEHEKFLTENIFKKAVFITDYPKDIKSFYMRRNDDEKTVAATDMLVPGIGELIGGSQREERLDLLIKRMQELNLNLKDYWWYLDLRKYGTVKHAGFGIGFERLIMFLTGVSNIRDVIPFPRTIGNAEF